MSNKWNITDDEIHDEIVKAHFMDKPFATGEEKQLFKEYLIAGKRIGVQESENRIRKLVRHAQGSSAPTALITISVDQELTHAETIARQHKIIQRILSAQYKWFIEASYCYEYYSSNQKWNPHIHIKLDKITSASVMAQQLRRKLKDLTHYINVSIKTEEIHNAYISGIKTEAKTINHEMDENFRKSNNIQNIYLVKQ